MKCIEYKLEAMMVAVQMIRAALFPNMQQQQQNKKKNKVCFIEKFDILSTMESVQLRRVTGKKQPQQQIKKAEPMTE